MRRLEFDSAALEDLAWWVQQDRKKALRILRLILETQGDPFGGIGKPDRLVIDLDPGEGLDLDDVAAVARLVADHLRGEGYTPVPLTQTVTVTNGLSTAATVGYSTSGGGLNLCVDGAYITQAVQTFDNSVPLVAGRNALLRVFVRANTANSAQPAVRGTRFAQRRTASATRPSPRVGWYQSASPS